MIVLDESIYDHRLARSIAHWYPGQVISVIALRANTLVKDEAIPMLLQAVAQPTFVTINISVFWKILPPHTGYCIIAADLRQEDSLEVGDLLRRCLRLSEFRTKNNRMGKVILLRPKHLEYYSLERRIIRQEF
jgi:hypothetical protein